MQAPPQGTVTLMFTDVEGSTAKWETYPVQFGEALQIHNKIVREAIAQHGGYEVKTAGDGFMVAFAEPVASARCAEQIRTELRRAASWHDILGEVGGIRVRIGIHTGQPSFRDNDYFGPVVNRAARICDAAHGGMILLSAETVRKATPNALAPGTLQDCGPHKLKDLGEPERLYLLLPPGSPAPTNLQLRTLNRVPNNFPAQVTAFVGRKKEIQGLMEMLREQQSRLITLTGPGGTGKTRLAMQVAADRLQEYPDGVWLVELAGVSDPDAVPAAVALTLGVEMKGEEPLEPLVEFLNPKRCLMVLDNFEQVSGAGSMLGTLLRECPTLTCIVTSREVLHVYGEREFTLEPLSVPPAGKETDWMEYESVQLFVDRCQTARPDFALTRENGPVIAEICRRLDGIPLAIELAAARARGMAPAQILQRLASRLALLSSQQQDLPERQRTLRNTIDWSYDLLSEDERSFFAELAVFQGGCYLEAVEEICPTPGAFDLLFSLRDKSLVHAEEARGETRYRMLETLREYATEKLNQAGRSVEMRHRHADYYLGQAEQWNERLAGSGEDAAEAIRVFTTEIENMRAGMDWLLERDIEDKSKIITYGKSLAGFLRRRGLYVECETRLALAADAARAVGDQRSLARLLNQRGLAAWESSDFASAQPLFTESYEISKELGDRPRMLVSLINLGNVHWGRGEFGEAKRAWEEALELAIETKQERYEAYIRDDLGILACQNGDYEAAAEYCERGLELHRQLDNQEGIAFSLYNSSEVLRRGKQYDRALSRVERAHQAFETLGHERGCALTSIRIGMILLEKGDPKAGVVHAEEGVRISTETGDRQGQSYGLAVMGRISSALGDREKAVEYLKQSFQVAKRIGDKKHIADLLHYFGEMEQEHDRAESAYRALVVAHREYASLGLADAEEVNALLETLAAGMEPDYAALLAETSAQVSPKVILDPGTGPLVAR